MYCDYCQSDFCSCSRESLNSQAQGQLMAWGTIALLCAIFIVFVAFGVSAYKILSAPKQFDPYTGKLKITSLEWLYLSPLCVGFSGYAVMMALGFLLGGADDSVLIIPAVIFILGMLLSLITFVGKNWKPLVETIGDKSYFSVEKKWSTVGLAVITLITLLPAPLVAAAIAARKAKASYESYVASREIIDAERPNFDRWTGTYKLITRNDSTLFAVSKSSSNDTLLLRTVAADSSKKSRRSESDCLLVPIKSKYPGSHYRYENCISEDGKPSPLASASFKESKDGTVTMHFYYSDESNGSVLGDDLEKIK